LTPSPDERLKLGDRAMLAGDYAAAQAYYREALAAGAQPDRAAFFLARAQFDGGDPAGARATLENLLSAQPAGEYSLRADFLLGDVAAAMEDWNAAAGAYQDFLANGPGLMDDIVLERIGDSYLKTDRSDLAVQSYNAAADAAAPAESMRLLEKEADAFRDSGQPEAALALYERVVTAVTSDWARARLNRKIGGLLIAADRSEEGYERYRAALQYPLSYDAYLCLLDLVNTGQPPDGLLRGIIDYDAGQYGTAVQVFTDYLAGGPADAGKALYYRGLAHQSLGDAQSAVADFDAAAAAGSDTGIWDQALFEGAYTRWYWLDDFAGGASILEGLADSAPAHASAAEALYTAGRIAERGGDLARAAQLWNRTAEDYPASEYAADARHFAGIALYRKEDFTGAEAAFQASAFSTDAWNRSRALFWTAKAKAARGDTGGARSALEQAASAAPTDYYSERAADLLAGRTAFTGEFPASFSYDLDAEYRQAEAWIQTAFPSENSLTMDARYASLKNDPRLARGRILWDLGLSAEARTEFDGLRASFSGDPAGMLFLSRYFVEIGNYSGAIRSAYQVVHLAGMNDAESLTAPKYFSHVRFGPYFAELLMPQADRYGMDPMVLFSLVWQESHFEASAVSEASAYGLMQIIPATAELMATRLGLTGLSDRDWSRPAIQVQLGSGYLAWQRDDFGGDLFPALAAYNGGPDNAAAWWKTAGGDDDLFLEVVRFEQTRGYVRAIYELYSIYRDLYSVR
jgi:soluble lytic murein transglycosylase